MAILNWPLKLHGMTSNAMLSVLRKARSLNLDIDTQLKLFDSTVLPRYSYLFMDVKFGGNAKIAFNIGKTSFKI